MHRDQRHHETSLGTNRHDDRGHERGNHDVIRRRRQTHTKDERQHGHEEEQDHKVAARDHLDHLADDLMRTGQRDGSHDNTGGPGRDTDPNHVAGTKDQTVNEIGPAIPKRSHAGLMHLGLSSPEERLEGAMGQRHDNHEEGCPESGERGRQPFEAFGAHHEVPHENEDRQGKIGPA